MRTMSMRTVSKRAVPQRIESPTATPFPAWRQPAILCLAIAGLALILTAGLAPAATSGGGDVSTLVVPKSHTEVRPFIFHAVVEGLYHDGVRTTVVERLATIDIESGAPRYLVHGCPLCMPVLDGLRLYAVRPRFHSTKEGSDTFGAGLGEEMRARIASEDPKVVRDALQELVGRWIDTALDRRRLTASERAVWQSYISDLREKGNAMLDGYVRSDDEHLRRVYEGWRSCPVCEGSNDGAVGGM